VPLVLGDGQSRLKQDIQTLVARYTNRKAPSAAEQQQAQSAGLFGRLFR